MHTEKFSFNSERRSLRSETISVNWKSLKNHEKYFLFYLNKLNLLLVNQKFLLLCIFIKLNLWYLYGLKTMATKRWFPFNLVKVLQGQHFVVSGPKDFKLLADIFFENDLQNIVLSIFIVLVIKLTYNQWQKLWDSHPVPLIQCWLQICLLISDLHCLTWLLQAWHNIKSGRRRDSG